MAIMVSRCLLGDKCNYKGEGCLAVLALRITQESTEKIVTACPEQLLGTPRTPAEIQRGAGEDVLDGRARVMTRDGRDVTAEFIAGAFEALKSAKENGVELFIGRAKSPSCGVGSIHDGTFSGTLREGDGVTVALLRRSGIKVLCEWDLDEALVRSLCGAGRE